MSAEAEWVEMMFAQGWSCGDFGLGAGSFQGLGNGHSRGGGDGDSGEYRSEGNFGDGDGDGRGGGDGDGDAEGGGAGRGEELGEGWGGGFGVGSGANDTWLTVEALALDSDLRQLPPGLGLDAGPEVLAVTLDLAIEMGLRTLVAVSHGGKE